MNHCDCCEYADKCELADGINFCEDCRDFGECTIACVFCEAGHAIECNNGFEVKDGYCEDYEEEE